ncbi:MAG: WecB/TagA/CpsF family glycosyltransferase [Gomphosphaeria aponina SAG 52.96 = DSM 107014]|uniref:WecB/TagA/CpsF family glycosyltransferase n=1 Tax=Gomphosphaeria aponina SAG 52.96 = DSM 107014 TaxID=1521640 RepID=A0A941GTL1_9CHRO|nr:WecB/TagA/CpsF family glycosyltransferase [Gomphosphaeria aponina SAG 52.96 = DSM 107014]
MNQPTKFSVLDLPVHLLDDYSSYLIERLHQQQGTHVVTLNAEMVMLAERNSSVSEVIQNADLVIPDGAGIIIYLRWRGKKQQRSPGIELAESLLQELGKLGDNCPICFYGGQPGVAEKAAKVWAEKVPGISIITSHGYLSPEEQEQWKITLQVKQPQLILVGLGVPRQEFWISANRSFCPQAIWIGVGGSFDIWSGTKSRAPALLRDNHLEWLYRLYQEPWRWRRMLVLPQFFFRSLFP